MKVSHSNKKAKESKKIPIKKSVASELRYRRLFETAQDGIILIDAQTGVIRDINHYLVKMLGYSKKSFLTKHLWEIGVFKNVAKSKSNFYELKKKRYIRYENLPLKTKGGKEIEVEFVANTYSVGDGEIIQCNIRDITARKKIENKLKESASLLSSIMETSTDGILVINRLGKVSFYNQRFTELWKIPLNIVKSSNDKKLLTYVIRQLTEPQEFLTKVNYLYKHPGLSSADVVSFKDGRFFERLSLPQKMGASVIGRVWRFHDITERKKNELQLTYNESRFRALYENSPVSMFLVDLSGRFINVNLAAEKMLGYSEAELQQLTFGDITHPDEVRRDVSKIKELIQGKISTYIVEKRYIAKNKKIIFVRIHSTLIRDANKKPLHFLTVAEDITEHKIFEEQIKKSEEKYSCLVDSSVDGVIVIQNGKIKFVNSSLEKMGGYNPGEVLGTNFIDLVAPKFKKMVADIYTRRMRGEKVISRYGFDIVVKDDGFLAVEVNTSLIDFEGKPAAMAVIRDVSRAKQLDKVKSEFISVASHQLRSPLTGIKWFSQLLADQKVGTLTPKQIDFIQQIYNSNERMIRLVNDLLDVSHIETGQKFSIEKKSGNVINLIKSVIVEQKISSPKKDITIELDKSCPAKLIFNFDQDKVYQVFSNLINNSIKYSAQDKKISIGVRCSKGEVEFSIKDSGYGIPERQKDRIFQKFFRADNIATISTEGTGLGLYIAKSIIEAHGGKIWFDSKENKGTTFYFTLPLKKIINKATV